METVEHLVDASPKAGGPARSIPGGKRPSRSRRSGGADTGPEPGLSTLAKEGKELLWACAQGNVNVVRRILSSAPGFGVSLARCAQDHRDLGPLHFACSSGCLSLVQMLCEAPHSLDARGTFGGLPPISVAAIYGHLAVVRYLDSVHGALDASSVPDTLPHWDTLVRPAADARLPCPLVPSLGEADGQDVAHALATTSSTPFGGADADLCPRLLEVREWLSDRLVAGSAQPQAKATKALGEGSAAKVCSGSGSSRVVETPRRPGLSSMRASLQKGAAALRRSISSSSMASSATSRGGSTSLRKRRGLSHLVVQTGKEHPSCRSRSIGVRQFSQR